MTTTAKKQSNTDKEEIIMTRYFHINLGCVDFRILLDCCEYPFIREIGKPILNKEFRGAKKNPP